MEKKYSLSLVGTVLSITFQIDTSQAMSRPLGTRLLNRTSQLCEIKKEPSRPLTTFDGSQKLDRKNIDPLEASDISAQNSGSRVWEEFRKVKRSVKEFEQFLGKQALLNERLSYEQMLIDLKTNPRLDRSKKGLKDADLIPLMKALEGNKNIQKLDLRDNQINEEGIKFVLKHASLMPSLKKIDLRGNPGCYGLNESRTGYAFQEEKWAAVFGSSHITVRMWY